MGNLSILSRSEIEGLGPPMLEELADSGIHEQFLCDLALKHVAMLPEPSTTAVADRLHLPRVLTEELLYHLYREKLIEMRLQSAVGSTRYAMLDHGWERVGTSEFAKRISWTSACFARRLLADDATSGSAFQACVDRHGSQCFQGSGVAGFAPANTWLRHQLALVTLSDRIARNRKDGRVGAHEPGARSARSGFPMQSKSMATSFASSMHIAIVRSRSELRSSNTIAVGSRSETTDHRRWRTDPRQHGPRLVGLREILRSAFSGEVKRWHTGHRRLWPPTRRAQDLLNRWILPLERRVDFLTLHSGKKIEVPFEQLVVFSTNLDERDLVDEAFLRRMGYRARVEPPTAGAFSEIFKRTAKARGVTIDEECLRHILKRYTDENRVMKGCEPRDLLNKVNDICLFEGREMRLTKELVDLAWGNYFGTSHGFAPEVMKFSHGLHG